VEKDKVKKSHPCLKPIYEFKELNLQITILYMPNYLANAEYELKKIYVKIR